MSLWGEAALVVVGVWARWPSLDAKQMKKAIEQVQKETRGRSMNILKVQQLLAEKVAELYGPPTA